jgi:hypothetical protein
MSIDLGAKYDTLGLRVKSTILKQPNKYTYENEKHHAAGGASLWGEPSVNSVVAGGRGECEGMSVIGVSYRSRAVGSREEESSVS